MWYNALEFTVVVIVVAVRLPGSRAVVYPSSSTSVSAEMNSNIGSASSMSEEGEGACVSRRNGSCWDDPEVLLLPAGAGDCRGVGSCVLSSSGVVAFLDAGLADPMLWRVPAVLAGLEVVWWWW